MYSIDLLENEYLPRSGIYLFLSAKSCGAVLLIEELLHQLIQRSFHFWYYIIYIYNQQVKYSFMSLHHSTTVCISKSLAENDEVRTSDRLASTNSAQKASSVFFWSAKTPYIPTAPRAEKAFLDEGVLLFFFHIFLLVFQKLGETTTPKDVAQHRNG